MGSCPNCENLPVPREFPCIHLLRDFVVVAVRIFFHTLFFGDTMSGTKIEHKTYLSLYKDSSSDPRRKNDDVAKVEKLAKYLHPWRTKDGAILEGELKQIVSDHFADHNIGGIGVWVAGPTTIPVLKAFVGLKKYTSDPSSPFSTLFGHHYWWFNGI